MSGYYEINVEIIDPALAESLERRVSYLEEGGQEKFDDDDHIWADSLKLTATQLRKLKDDDRAKMIKELRKQFDAEISDTEAYIEDAAERMRQVWELFQTMAPKQVVNDETLFRELKERFGSPYGFGEYFRGGMGAESVRDLLEQVDLEAECEELEHRWDDARNGGRAFVFIGGDPGIGKTRLALQVAAETHDAYPDGVWFVDLAPIKDPSLEKLLTRFMAAFADWVEKILRGPGDLA